MIALRTSRIGAAARRSVVRSLRTAKISRGIAGRWRSREHDAPRSASRSIVDLVGDGEVAVDEDVEQRPEQEALLGRRGARLRWSSKRRVTSSRSTGVPSTLRWRTVSSHPGPMTMSISRLTTLVVSALAVVHRHVEVVAVAHQLGALARVEDGIDHGVARGRGRRAVAASSSRRGRRRVDPQHRARRVERRRAIWSGSTSSRPSRPTT